MSFQGFLPAPKANVAGVEIPLGQAMIFTFYATAANYTTLAKSNEYYQVPTGYKLVLVAVKMITVTAALSTLFPGYGDTSVQNSAAAPTNNVPVGNAIGPTLATAGEKVEMAMYCEVPAGKYPTFQAVTGAVRATVLGYLQKV